MNIIALISRKGGSGKSTLCAALAVEAAAAGLETVAIDLDPQRSLAEWGERRSAAGFAAPTIIAAPAARLVAVIEEAGKGGGDLVLIDTAGRNDAAALAAARAADLVLIAAQSSVADLLAVPAALEIVRLAGDTPALAVLTRTTGRGARARDAAEYLERIGLPVVGATINRVEHQDAFAAGAGPGGKAAKEIEALFAALARHLGIRRRKRKTP